ncbi:MAG TPA: glycosyltransferase family 4 protein [Bacteroidales bacterium]|jgi:glycosyltransferase involved in cell wall biosynthesis|nr:glycosyltransferase family 4 protein [Deltaproteobacteria bacterium]HQB53440.1 glycosyltransferase family 4 protein [Bacteroidales bacterium]
MRILHINSHDASGGAARAAMRLHLALLGQGIPSRMFVENRQSSDIEGILEFKVPGNPSRMYWQILKKTMSRPILRAQKASREIYDVFTDDRSPCGKAVLKQLPEHDIINLHWIAGFIDYRDFFSCNRKRPIIWTLHDMNPFTGGCHYTNGCDNFTRQCGTCPQLNSSNPHDLSRRIWRRKQSSFTNIEPGRLHIVTPSEWLAREATRSSLMGRFPISCIPNCVDTNTYSPRDRSAARIALGIPTDARVLLFVAASLDNRRKGFKKLLAVLEKLDSLTDLYLISLGKTGAGTLRHSSHLNLGNVSSDRLLALVYNAADCFVIPSSEDNLPNTVLEAMSCGTPVAGFAVGGIPEMVASGSTGILAEHGDIVGLSNAVRTILTQKTLRETMSRACREAVLKEYTPELQAHRYLELYRQMGGGF